MAEWTAYPCSCSPAGCVFGPFKLTVALWPRRLSTSVTASIRHLENLWWRQKHVNIYIVNIYHTNLIIVRFTLSLLSQHLVTSFRNIQNWFIPHKKKKKKTTTVEVDLSPIQVRSLTIKALQFKDPNPSLHSGAFECADQSVDRMNPRLSCN